MDADYADDIALLANTPTKAKTLLHSLGRAIIGIGFDVNAEKTVYPCFNQRGGISTLKCRLLKLLDKLTNLQSIVFSTEKDINT